MLSGADPAARLAFPAGGPGEVAEWSIAPHSKCGVRASVPGVRIPPSPPTVSLKHLILLIILALYSHRSQARSRFYRALSWRLSDPCPTKSTGAQVLHLYILPQRRMAAERRLLQRFRPRLNPYNTLGALFCPSIRPPTGRLSLCAISQFIYVVYDRYDNQGRDANTGLPEYALGDRVPATWSRWRRGRNPLK
jgi:hypothetical protein